MKACPSPPWYGSNAWEIINEHGDALAWLNECLDPKGAAKLARQFAASDRMKTALQTFLDALDVALQGVPPDACVALMNDAEEQAREILEELEGE